MSQVFDPYSNWLGIPPRDHPPDHYALLGLRPFEQDPKAIRAAADRQAAAVRRHRTGENAEVSQRILFDLSAATQCLLNPAKKAEYDDCLRQAHHMDDTRSMSGAELDVEPGSGRGDGPSWQMDPNEEESSPGGETGTAAESDSDLMRADSDSELWLDDESFSSDASHSDVDWPASPQTDRRPLIAVVLIASAVGMMLVGLFATVAAFSRTRPGGTTVEGPPLAAEVPTAASETVLANKQTVLADETASTVRSVPTDSDEPLSAAEPPLQPETVVVEKPVASTSEVEESLTDPLPDGAVALNLVEELAHSAVEAPVPLPPPEQRPIPTDEEQRRLWAAIDAAHGVAELGTRREILDVAEQLIEAAQDPGQSSALRYALLVRAMQLAGPPGDAILTLSAAERIRAGFQVDEEAIQPLITEALGDQIEPRRARRQRFVAALQTFEQNPDDPPANTELGRYYCFERDDWQRGLPYLARGENTALRLLAEDETSGIDTWQQELELGHGWWAISRVSDGAEQAASQERAANWYRNALPDLEGADKRRVQSRLGSLIALPGSDAADAAAVPPGDDPPLRVGTPAPDAPAPDAPAPDERLDLTGVWRSDRFQSVFRLRDDGQTVRCELVSSKMVQQVDGIWVRQQEKLACDRWRFRFAEDPLPRFWDLKCEPQVVDAQTIRLKSEIVMWDRLGREIKRQWATAVWRKDQP